MDLVVNPAGFEEQYNTYVGRVFPQWGGQPMYDWCYHRIVESLSADILLLQENGVPIAGTGLTYRKVSIGNASVHAGILTGSWTTPEARGRGCFSRLIEESRQRVAQRDGQLLLAFVRSTNPSYRRLAASGALCVPSFYLKFSPGEAGDAPRIDTPKAVADPVSSITKIFEQERSVRATGSVSFVYSLDSFLSQYLHRPGGTDLWQLHSNAFALVSNYDDLIVLHYLSNRFDYSQVKESLLELVSSAVASAKRMILYSTDESFVELCTQSGFECDSGFVTVNHATKGWDDPELKQLHEKLSQSNWDLQDGDKM